MVKCSNCKREWLVGEERCTMHIRGNLMKTLTDFQNNEMQYLLIAGAEHGADLDWSKVQFVLKYPFGSLDDRARSLETIMGKPAFNAYYNGDARTRLIQSAGRNCRGEGDVGFTVILDAKFYEDYSRNKMLYPAWFRESFDGVVY